MIEGEGGAFCAGVIVMFAFCTVLHSCDLAQKQSRFAFEACELACQRHHAGKAHAADETWCTCTSGIALKRDRSRLYVRAAPGTE